MVPGERAALLDWARDDQRDDAGALRARIIPDPLPNMVRGTPTRRPREGGASPVVTFDGASTTDGNAAAHGPSWGRSGLSASMRPGPKTQVFGSWASRLESLSANC